MEIKLDENHIYHVGNVRKPSVSKVLDLYFPPTGFYSEEGRELGIASHSWFDFLARGCEPTEEPDERIADEVAAFRKFLAEVKPLFIFGEKILYDDVLGVCGKPDLYCEIQGRPSVIDYKPRNSNVRWIAQTAAYQCLIAANGFPVLDRYALRLLPGNYRLDQHKDKNDLSRWRAFVAGFKARDFYEQNLRS